LIHRHHSKGYHYLLSPSITHTRTDPSNCRDTTTALNEIVCFGLAGLVR
jgi:hypothetical protein